MIQGFKNVCRASLRIHTQLKSNYSSSKLSIKEEWKKRRNVMFDNEVSRLESESGRIEKVTVKFYPVSSEDQLVELKMNRNLSTPSDCAKHIHESVYETGAIALVNGEPWDMNKPFVDDCDLRILTMKMPDKLISINNIFWRSCSFLLGAMVESSFKDDIPVYLHSFPRPNVKSGSFVYDVIIDLPDWKPTNAEMRALSAQFVRLTNKSLPIQRLEISETLALDMFQDNPYKSKQIPEIAKANEGRITLYRAGDHIDISKGPMVGHTGIIGKTTIAAVHKIESDESDHMYRFQGVALPRGTYLNHFAFGILEQRARLLNNTAWMPNRIAEENVENESSLVAKN